MTIIAKYVIYLHVFPVGINNLISSLNRVVAEFQKRVMNYYA